MLANVGAILYFLFAIGSVGFGVIRFMHEEVTNGLLSLMLGAIVLNLAVRWMATFRD